MELDNEQIEKLTIHLPKLFPVNLFIGNTCGNVSTMSSCGSSNFCMLLVRSYSIKVLPLLAHTLKELVHFSRPEDNRLLYRN